MVQNDMTCALDRLERSFAAKVRRIERSTKPGIAKWRGAMHVRLSVAFSLQTIMQKEGRRVDIVHRPGANAWVWVGRQPKAHRPVCGARTRSGGSCKARCTPLGTRCRMHGGLSTGPTSEEGRQRIRESNQRRKGEKRNPTKSDSSA